MNQGSKVVFAAVGPPRRELATEIPGDLDLPPSFSNPKIALPGVLVINGPRCSATDDNQKVVERFCEHFDERGRINRFPMIVIFDDSDFASATINNFLWVTFTRSNPASDIHGIDSSMIDKHWGCQGSLVIDSRIKPSHAPPLIEDPEVSKRVDSLAAKGGKIARYL